MSSEKNELPKHIVRALLADPRFSECLDESLNTEELVKQFERLYGVSRPRTPDSPIAAMIYKSTGYTEGEYRKFFAAFIPFVYDIVYTRICENPILPEANCE